MKKLMRIMKLITIVVHKKKLIKIMMLIKMMILTEIMKIKKSDNQICFC